MEEKVLGGGGGVEEAVRLGVNVWGGERLSCKIGKSGVNPRLEGRQKT